MLLLAARPSDHLFVHAITHLVLYGSMNERSVVVAQREVEGARDKSVSLASPLFTPPSGRARYNSSIHSVVRALCLTFVRAQLDASPD